MKPQNLCCEEIYDCLTDEEAFSALPRRLAATFEASSALIHWIYKDGTAAVMSHSGYFSDAQLGVYAQSFASLDPWVAATREVRFANQAHNLEEIVPPAEFERSQFYNEYIRAMGDDTFRCIGIRVENDWGSGFLALQRGRSQNSFEPEALEALEGWSRHLRRMLSMRGKLLTVTEKAASLAETLDTMGDAVFLLSDTGVLLHANAGAGDMLARTRGLVVRGGKLCARNIAADAALRRAVEAVSAASQPEAIAVSIPTGDGMSIPFSLAAVPSGISRRNILMVSKDPYLFDRSKQERLRSLYQLSNREAQLAVALADGATPQDIAEDWNIAIGTVRTQIKNLSSKMGCHRQADIVRLVGALPKLRLRK